MSKKHRGRKRSRSLKQQATAIEKMRERMDAFRVRNLLIPRRRKQS